MWIILVDTARKSTERKGSYKKRNFSVPDKVGETSRTFSGSQHRVFPFSCWLREGFRKEQRIQIIQRGLHSESMEAIRAPCATSSSRRGIPAY